MEKKVEKNEPQDEIRTAEEIRAKVIELDIKINERRSYDLTNPDIQSEIIDWRTQIKALKWALKEEYNGNIYYERLF